MPHSALLQGAWSPPFIGPAIVMLFLLPCPPSCLQGYDLRHSARLWVGQAVTGQDVAPTEAQLPSGVRHPEELSLLRAPEKKEKKKKEKEPEEEVYDLTKVVLAGGEHRLGQPGAGRRGQAHGAGGWGARPG